MKYCISGSSGFIGQAISKYLLNRGDHVYDIFRYLTVDELINYFKTTQPDCIIHLATYGNHYNSQTDLKKMIDVNIIGTYNLLEAAKAVNCSLFYNFIASTISGEFFYTTKYCAEVLAEKYGAINVRPYSVYGPGEAQHKFIPTVIHHLNSNTIMEVDEEATHAWIFIDDLVEAFFAGETELGGGRKITNKEIIEILENISGKKLNYINRKIRSYDNNDWKAPKGICYTGIYEGLKRTYEYFTR
jgi:nucleoside-diphosphate-sugar epimerase